MPQIYFSYSFVAQDGFGHALGDYAPFTHDIRSVAYVQGLAHIVVSYQNADIALAQVTDNPLDIDDGNRVDAGEGLVQKHESGFRGKRPGDFHPAPLAPRQALTAIVPKAPHMQLLEKLFQALLLLDGLEVGLDLEYAEDILFHRQATENGWFLGQISEA